MKGPGLGGPGRVKRGFLVQFPRGGLPYGKARNIADGAREVNPEKRNPAARLQTTYAAGCFRSPDYETGSTWSNYRSRASRPAD
jgi:hypothetical protein